MPVPKASYAHEHTGDSQLDRMQQELTRLRSILARCPFIDGSLVEGVDIPALSSVTVRHGLGRTPKGFIVVAADQPSSIGLTSVQPSDPTRLIKVQATAAVTASIWFW